MRTPYIIGISGGSGSGKTSILKALRDSFPATDLCILSQDDYYRPREEQKMDENGIINFDKPKCIDKKALVNDILCLQAGVPIEKLEYVFNNPSATPKKLLIHPAPVLVVEGLFVFHFKKVSQLLDLQVYIETSDVLKVIRRIKRDQLERNYPLEDVLYRYERHVQPAYEKYIKPYLSGVDLILNNNDHYEKGVEVLQAYIQFKLEAIAKEDKH